MNFMKSDEGTREKGQLTVKKIICIFCQRYNCITSTLFKDSNILDSSSNIVLINLSQWAVFILSHMHGCRPTTCVIYDSVQHWLINLSRF